MASTEQVVPQHESAVEAINDGHGLGVYSLEFQNHVESESKKIIANTPGIKPKKLAKKVEKAWNQKHPLLDLTPADKASPASASEAAASTAAGPLSTPPTAASSITNKPAPARKHHKKKPAGTTSDLQSPSNGASNKQSTVKAQGYADEIVVAKITEITSGQEDEST